MDQLTKSFTYYEFQNSEELSNQDQELVKLSREATKSAYAPYSGFYVGAAVILEDGTIIKGNNQENAAYPSGLCAERVAVFSASAVYPNATIKAIAISAYSEEITIDKPISPCGSCRQVILEYEKKQDTPIKIILTGQKGKVIIINSISDLLPLNFTDKDLNK